MSIYIITETDPSGDTTIVRAYTDRDTAEYDKDFFDNHSDSNFFIDEVDLVCSINLE